jgi:hypothetical protein
MSWSCTFVWSCDLRIATWLVLPFCFPLILICILAMLMAYCCVEPCKSSFSACGGLNWHQSVCSIYKTSQSLKLEHRQQMAAAKVSKGSTSHTPCTMSLDLHHVEKSESNTAIPNMNPPGNTMNLVRHEPFPETSIAQPPALMSLRNPVCVPRMYNDEFPISDLTPVPATSISWRLILHETVWKVTSENQTGRPNPRSPWWCQ